MQCLWPTPAPEVRACVLKCWRMRTGGAEYEENDEGDDSDAEVCGNEKVREKPSAPSVSIQRPASSISNTQKLHASPSLLKPPPSMQQRRLSVPSLMSARGKLDDFLESVSYQHSAFFTISDCWVHSRAVHTLKYAYFWHEQKLTMVKYVKHAIQRKIPYVKISVFFIKDKICRHVRNNWLMVDQTVGTAVVELHV